MYLTTTLSVALVLFLVGLESVLMLSARSLVERVKQNVTVTAVLTQSADTAVLNPLLTQKDYCHHFTYISAEQALKEHIRSLGEDPSKFLGYNPLSASYELHLKAAYAVPDSLPAIERDLMAVRGIAKVIYQKDLLSVVNKNIHEISILLFAVALILLLIAVALIINTIRLHIYSKRFLINTMTLVGATSWMIKAPIVRKNIGIGLVAAILALAALAGAIYYVQLRLGILLFPLTPTNVALLSATVVLSGVLITFFASLFATGHYIRMKTDTMYEI